MPRSKAFKRLYESMKKSYLHDDVPARFRRRYGKRYDEEDVKSFAIAVAKKKGIKY